LAAAALLGIVIILERDAGTSTIWCISATRNRISANFSELNQIEQPRQRNKGVPEISEPQMNADKRRWGLLDYWIHGFMFNRRLVLPCFALIHLV
jgi:hypothetical protein